MIVRSAISSNRGGQVPLISTCGQVECITPNTSAGAHCQKSAVVTCWTERRVSGPVKATSWRLEPPAMTTIHRAAAAVTGAASGIGRALALELAGRGCDLALADRDEAGLKALAAEIGRGPSPKVTIHGVDVSEPSEIAAFAQAATSAHSGLNILVNNAGVALFGGFSEIDLDQMEWLINI